MILTQKLLLPTPQPLRRRCHVCKMLSAEPQPLCTVYLAVWRNVLEGAIFNRVFSARRVAQLGVTLHIPRGQFDPGCLGLGEVWRVEIVISFKDHELLLTLGDVGGVGLQDMRENHFNRNTDLGSWCQRRWQLHREEFSTGREKMGKSCEVFPESAIRSTP